jgi:putative endonuclease
VKRKPAEQGGGWFVYILRCADGTLYTGITTDPDRRLAQHNAGTASKYTRARRPAVIAYREEQPDRSSASKREAALKSLRRHEKERLCGRRGKR